MPGDRPQAVIRPEPGVSWMNLLSQHYRGPEQRSRRLPKVAKQNPTRLRGMAVVSRPL